MEDQMMQGVRECVGKVPLSGDGVANLDRDRWDTSPVYYRVILGGHGKLCVVTMQDFDEDDYDKSRFVRDASGERMYWYDEDEAKIWLSENFKPEFILEKDRVATPLSLEHMRR